MLARVYVRHFRLCVKRVLCIKTAKHFVEILLPPDSPIIMVFRHRGSLLNSDGFNPNGGTEYKGGGNKIGKFVTNKSVYLGNGAAIIAAIKSNRKPYPSYRMVALSMTLSDPTPVSRSPYSSKANISQTRACYGRQHDVAWVCQRQLRFLVHLLIDNGRYSAAI